MKFLLTGAGGQLGAEWLSFFEENSLEHCSFDSKHLDITDREAVRSAILENKPDVLINCAAYTSVDQAESSSEKAFKVNAEAVGILAEYCSEMKVKMVHFSTDYVFPGKKEDAEKYPDGYPEDSEKNPVNLYGKSKLRGEHLMQASGCEFLLIRVSWLCGRYGNNFVKTMLDLVRERDQLKVVNDQLGAPTFTESVVSNTYTLIRNQVSGTFHLSSTGKISWYDFAREIFEQKQIKTDLVPVSSDEFPTPAQRPAFSLLSTKKITNITGVRLQDWKTGLERLLEHL